MSKESWKRLKGLLCPGCTARVQQEAQGEQFYIPKGLEDRAKRDARICRLRRSGDTVPEIAGREGLSERHVKTILAEHGVSAPGTACLDCGARVAKGESLNKEGLCFDCSAARLKEKIRAENPMRPRPPAQAEPEGGQAREPQAPTLANPEGVPLAEEKEPPYLAGEGTVCSFCGKAPVEGVRRVYRLGDDAICSWCYSRQVNPYGKELSRKVDSCGPEKVFTDQREEESSPQLELPEVPHDKG